MSVDPQAAPDGSGADAIYQQLLRILAEGSRTQLGLIDETTQGLLQSADPSQRGPLERVRQGVWELGTLLSDVSAFYAYSTGHLTEADADFDLRVTLEGVRSRLSRSQSQAGWMAVSRIRHDVPPLLQGKPARLQDILLGVTAALVATWPEGTLRIDTSKGWERDQSIELVFRCEARPATPPTAEQVESFRRRLTAAGESPELARHDLRLQLAQRRTVASGGSLKLVDDAGGAPTFELRMPFAVRSVRESLPASGPPVMLRGRRALICDTSDSRRGRLEAILRLWGLETKYAWRRQGVLELLRNAAAQGQPFDFALVDAELEDIAGAALGRIIREDPAHQATRLMLLFGVGLRGDAKLAEGAGYEAYLPRTISMQVLREALGEMLKRSAGESQGAAIVTQHSLADVRLEGVRILLVSSDPVGALVLEAVFRRKGFRVDRVRYVADAAERCEKTVYHFLVLDLVEMSEQDMSLAAGLRVLLEEHGPTQMVVLVERQNAEEVRGLDGLAPEAVFPKPVDLENICTFCEGSRYPQMAAGPMASGLQDAIAAVVADAPAEPAHRVETTLGDDGLQLSVVETYLEEMPRRVDAISAAVRAGDLAAAGREVRSARAMALTSGAGATARCLDALAELIARRRDEDAQAMLAQLRAESEISLNVLRAAHAGMRQEKRAA